MFGEGHARDAAVLYAALLDATSDIVFSLDAHGRHTTVNRALCEALKLPADRVLGRTHQELAFPEALVQEWQGLRQRVLAGESLRVETCAPVPRGERLYELSLAPIRNGGGRIAGLGAVARDITGQRRSEEVLREAESRFRGAFDSSAAGIALVAPDGRWLQVNRTLCEITGYSEEELLALTFHDITYPADLEAGLAQVSALLEGRADRYAIEKRYIHRDGHLVWVHLSVAIVRDRQRRPLYFVSSVRDITDRKRAEEVLRDSAARYQNLFGANPHPMWVYDTDTLAILEVNDAAVAHYGYSRNEFLGMTIADLRSPEDVPDLRRMLAGRSTGARVASLAARHRKKDGSISDVEITSNSVDYGGRSARLVLADDVTQRRRAEAEMRLQAAALDAAANAIVITDRDGRIHWVNGAFCRLTGYSHEEAIGKNPRDLVKSGVQDRDFFKRMWDTILAGRIWQGELVNRRKDGTLYPEAQTITPIVGEGGGIGHFIAIKQDLTETKRLEAQFLQAQKMESIGRLAAGIAHDFNNLLTVINGTAELVSASVPNSDPIRADLEEILQAGARAARLTRQLLAFSRKQIVVPVVLNLGALLDEMHNMLTRIVGEDIQIVRLPEQASGNVRADAGLIQQVILNLVVNARDAMPSGGALTIETHDFDLDDAYAAAHQGAVAGPYVMLAVSDTGVGMDAATRQRLFEPFFTTKEAGKGTGLGLSTVYGIVRQSGGTVEVDSERGVGTTFKVYLPRVTDGAAVTGSGRPRLASAGSETILLVEDEEPLRRFATRVLQSAGYTVLAVGDGKEALALVQRHEGPVDLVFTDVVLPEMGGRELGARLAAVRPQLKVLFTSGYTDDAVLQNGVLGNASHFIGKPYTRVELTRKVREVLDR